jgi:tRNA dimethylallyltransferase
MDARPQKIIAVVGPTASGKTGLGILLAKKFGGEVISTDSRQVYHGLNIGTGKATKKEMRGVRHHLIDVASPKRQFSADDFVKKARKACSSILQKARIPIVVGGTGFYVDALVGRITLPNVPPNPALRAKLEKKSVAQLFAQLQKLDPARATTIEPHHKRRLIRAIEIALGPERHHNDSPVKPNVLWLGLYPGEQKLKENIHKRLKSRLKTGMIAEAKKLHAGGLSYKRMRELGLEYRFLADYLQHRLTKSEMEEGLERAIMRYAKRQMRWFRRNPDITWLSHEREALRLAEKFVGGR